MNEENYKIKGYSQFFYFIKEYRIKIYKSFEY